MTVRLGELLQGDGGRSRNGHPSPNDAEKVVRIVQVDAEPIDPDNAPTIVESCAWPTETSSADCTGDSGVGGQAFTTTSYMGSPGNSLHWVSTTALK